MLAKNQNRVATLRTIADCVYNMEKRPDKQSIANKIIGIGAEGYEKEKSSTNASTVNKKRPTKGVADCGCPAVPS